MADTQTDREREQWAKRRDEHQTDFAKPPSPAGYLVGAWALWLVGLALEVLGVLLVGGVFEVPVLSDAAVLVLVVALVVDLAAVLAATRLNKRAQALKGARGQGTAAVVMATAAFVPMVLFFATAKNATAKTKALSIVAAVVVAGGLAAAIACSRLWS